MSLDVHLTKMQPCVVHHQNITHNLNKMAAAGGFYEAVWRPEEVGITQASQLIPILRKAIADMEDRPEFYKQFDSSNGWGTYKHFLPWLREYLAACVEYPDATVEADR